MEAKWISGDPAMIEEAVIEYGPNNEPVPAHAHYSGNWYITDQLDSSPPPEWVADRFPLPGASAGAGGTANDQPAMLMPQGKRIIFAL